MQNNDHLVFRALMVRNLADVEWLDEEAFKEAFRRLAVRLELSEKDSPGRDVAITTELLFWIRLSAALIKKEPEFRRPRSRPKQKGGGKSYDRYRAVRQYRRDHPEMQNAKQIEVIRKLIAEDHPLFAGYPEATMVKEVSRGKAIYDNARIQLEALAAKDPELARQIRGKTPSS